MLTRCSSTRILITISSIMSGCVTKSSDNFGHDLNNAMRAGSIKKFEGKIVGGTPISVDHFPYAVQFFNLGNLCAGTIINVWTVLTSAHCLDRNTNVQEMSIHAGSRYTFDFDAKKYSISSFVVHKEYNQTGLFACDIALLFVDEGIELGRMVQKAVLVDSDKWMSPKEKFAVTGWGWTKYGGPTSQLGFMMAFLTFVPIDECKRMHNTKFTPDMFCLYGDGERDACKGDSGGGVVWNKMIVGITSHGEGCAKKDKPSVYTSVWYFRDWIKQQVYLYIDKYCDSDLTRREDRKHLDMLKFQNKLLG